MGRWDITIVVTAIVIFSLGCAGKAVETPAIGNIPTETEITVPPSAPPPTASSTHAIRTQELRFTGNNTFTGVDDDDDGLFEALLVNVEVQSPDPGEYALFGRLQKDGALVANRPMFESALFSFAAFENGSGTHQVEIAFSGEQIFRSGQEGPYDLLLTVVGPDNKHLEATFSTPAIVHAQYGELPVLLTGANDRAVDIDHDGTFDLVNLAINVNVRASGEFSLWAGLSNQQRTLVLADGTFDLGKGTHTVDLQLPGSALRLSGEDGPYNATITVKDATGHTLPGLTFETQAYQSSSFSGQSDTG